MDARKKATLKRRLSKIAAVRKEIAILQDQLSTLQDEMVDGLDDAGIEKFGVELEDATVSASVVRSTSVQVDVEKLEGLVKPSMFKRVTKNVVNMPAFRDAIAHGDVSMADAEAVSTEVEKAPYLSVRVTYR